MDTLVRFGAGNQVYTFEQNQQISLRDNFRDVVPRTTRLPGLSGGFDEFGSGAAPGEIGNVQVMFWIFADSEAEMKAKKDEFGAMADWGVYRLYKQPMDGSPERYCEARLNSAEISETSADQPHKRNRVQLNFQVANPAWYSLGTESPSWGDGTAWGSGALWGGSAAPNAVVGLQNDFYLNVNGNARTYPRIEVRCGAAQTASGVTIQRLVQGVVVDEVKYDDTLNNNDRLIINCRALEITLNGSDNYSNDFTFQNAGWFRLEAGENTIRVLMDNAGDEADVYFRYYEAYK